MQQYYVIEVKDEVSGQWSDDFQGDWIEHFDTAEEAWEEVERLVEHYPEWGLVPGENVRVVGREDEIVDIQYYPTIFPPRRM